MTELADLPPLTKALAHRRWWQVEQPFRHVRAEGVFIPPVYDALVEAFRIRQRHGQLARNLPGYDAMGSAVTHENAGPFAIFLTREWHDLVAGLFDVRACSAVIATLHHHAAGSASGQLHNDLNPGWFPIASDDTDGIQVHDPSISNYRSGFSPIGVPTVERIRAIALLYYLDTPEDICGGGTGFYRSLSQPVTQPEVNLPPRNNSLVAFECTPFSLHSFISNVDRERNCLVMWLHRGRADVEQLWGSGSIVEWS
jgi:hypothetical protein